VVYKVDRLSRSLLDFAQSIGKFDEYRGGLVAVTQQLNTTTSMGRLTMNVLLSFAQFEPEMILERTRDKTAAARRLSVPKSLAWGTMETVSVAVDGRSEPSRTLGLSREQTEPS